MRTLKLYPFIFASLVIHTIAIALISNLDKTETASNDHRFKINRIVGEQKAKKKNLVYLKPKESKAENLSFKDLSIKNTSISKVQPTADSKRKIPFKEISSLRKKITASRARSHKSLSDLSDINLEFEVPEGVKEDELNKIEQIIYGFQRRVATKYVNSYLLELQNFQKNNLGKRFPSKDTEHVLGKLTFDSDGNILKIHSVKWSQNKDFQEFFVALLQRINGLPNPPKVLLTKNGEFNILFSLRTY